RDWSSDVCSSDLSPSLSSRCLPSGPRMPWWVLDSETQSASADASFAAAGSSEPDARMAARVIAIVFMAGLFGLGERLQARPAHAGANLPEVPVTSARGCRPNAQTVRARNANPPHPDR